MVTDDFKYFPQTGKLLGIDWGAKRIGLAVSDKEQNFVFTRPALFFTKFSKKILSFPQRREQGLEIQSPILKNILEIIHNENIKAIIIGLPLYLDGTESETTARVREFADDLASQLSTVNYELSIFLFDESLTSFAAEEDNLAHGRKKTENLDSVAAKIMLENALAHIRRKTVF